MADLRDLARFLDGISKQVTAGTEKVMRATALAAHSAVVLSTPVDTGAARSNWQVTLTNPAEGTRPPLVAGEGGSTGAQNSSAVLLEGQQRVGGFTLSAGTINLTNNLPYIQRLNEGWSKQAPSNFVETAVQNAVNVIKKSKLLNI